MGDSPARTKLFEANNPLQYPTRVNCSHEDVARSPSFQTSNGYPHVVAGEKRGQNNRHSNDPYQTAQLFPAPFRSQPPNLRRHTPFKVHKNKKTSHAPSGRTDGMMSGQATRSGGGAIQPHQIPALSPNLPFELRRVRRFQILETNMYVPSVTDGHPISMGGGRFLLNGLRVAELHTRRTEIQLSDKRQGEETGE